MPNKFLWMILAVVFTTGCVSRRIEVLRGSRHKYAIGSFWEVYAAAQNLLQKDGFIVNLTHQNRGILVATLTKGAKPNKVFDRMSNLVGASFHPGDQLHVLVSVAALPKNVGAEMRVSVLRERDNEWMQEDGDEIGNESYYTSFFKRVDKVVEQTKNPQ